MESIKLTHNVIKSGCAAKLPPGDLERALCGLELPYDSNLLVGLERADDAGVYKISEELAIVQTVDFFPPMVDDPYVFGQIAAANALSDVYAMGGTPKTAMNIVTFPSISMDFSVLRSVIEGGLSKIIEAGVVLVGGHTIEDNELKYGLSVTGFINPADILLKSNLKYCDKLILTKPLGTGIITTAIKAGVCNQELIDELTKSMIALNNISANVMSKFAVNACTDITGFGFLGHLAEMVIGSGFSVCIDSSNIYLFTNTFEFAAMGFVPSGAYSNKNFRGQLVDFKEGVAREIQDILFDPQTSGGLLISVSSTDANALLDELKSNGVYDCSIVGEVIREPFERIIVE